MKTISFKIIFLLAITTLYSQKKTSIGINSGLDYTTLRGNNFVEKNDGELSYLFGITFEYDINQNVSLLSNFNYSKKTIKYYYPKQSDVIIGVPIGQNPPPKPTVKNNTDFQYITIPVLVKYKFGEDLNLFINGGPFIGHLIDCQNYNEGQKNDIDFNQLFSKTNIGLSFGVGYNLDIDNKNAVRIELRDEFGLKNIGKGDNFVSKNAKTNSVNLILNWNLKL